MKTLVCNVWGAPCTAKSTLAMGVVSTLKRSGISAEYAHEYCKGLMWSEAPGRMSDQLIILAEQNHILRQLQGKVQVAVCDSPIPLSLVYNQSYMMSEFYNLVDALYRSYWNLDFQTVVPHWSRDKYEPWGRDHDYEESLYLHEEISGLASTKGAWVLSGDYEKDHDVVVSQIRVCLGLDEGVENE